MIEELIIIDSRVAGYSGEACRIMSVTSVNSGKINVRKEALYSEPIMAKDNVTVVTDTPSAFRHWSLSFDEKNQMQAVMSSYRAADSAGLITLHDSLRRYDLKGVIQTRKMDERGRSLDFDSMGINNGHIAILLAIWAARMAHGGFIITEQHDVDPNADDPYGDDEYDMMPFSI